MNDAMLSNGWNIHIAVHHSWGIRDLCPRTFLTECVGGSREGHITQNPAASTWMGSCNQLHMCWFLMWLWTMKGHFFNVKNDFCIILYLRDKRKWTRASVTALICDGGDGTIVLYAVLSSSELFLILILLLNESIFAAYVPVRVENEEWMKAGVFETRVTLIQMFFLVIPCALMWIIYFVIFCRFQFLFLQNIYSLRVHTGVDQWSSRTFPGL